MHSWKISIHTPARGVTTGCGETYTLTLDFNPHSRKGSDRNVFYKDYAVQISIHTPARGVTYYLSAAYHYAAISIHTPARGVTDATYDDFEPYHISIHTPARGVTIPSGLAPVPGIISIHTPARGVTMQESADIRRFLNFNPHSRKGSDISLIWNILK